MDYDTSTLILTACGYSSSSPPSSSSSVRGNNMIVTALNNSGNDRLKGLLGSTMVQYAEVTAWLSLVGSSSSSLVNDNDLSKINSILSSKSYLVGDVLTVADVAVYIAITTTLSSNNKGSNATTVLANYSNLIRWFDHIQHLCCPYSKLNTLTFANQNQTLLLPLSFKSDSSSSSSSSSSSVHAIKKTEKADKESKPSSESNAGKVEPPKTKKDQEPKKKEDKKEKPVEKTAAEELDPSKLDIRVGVIVTCQAHPEAEKLLVESIDVGEESPRTICSGLKAFYRPDEMIGRLVLVLGNLKDRTMVGVKSEGMVLCSCNADHSDVKLLDIPASAKPGDRVKFKGFDSEPASSSVVAKKKILESIAPFLNTNNDGVCSFKDIPFTVNDVIITAPIKNGVVS